MIVHIFRPEVRDYYNLESMWSVESPGAAGPDPPCACTSWRSVSRAARRKAR
ncbi:MAG: RsfS/YbeB/iojap family protein [Rhizomicrobium sp.]